MTKAYLIKQLNAITDARRVNRLSVANLVLENDELFPYLIDITLEYNNKTAIKGAWVLEFVCHKKLEWLTLYLDTFCLNLNKIKYGSALRPVAKICELLAINYNSKKSLFIHNKLLKKYIDLIIENAFDWLISNHKVAVKVYAMETLYLFGKNYDWVHEELRLLISQNITKESSAYKARGKNILNRLKQK